MSSAFTVAAILAAFAIPVLGFAVGALARPAEKARARRTRPRSGGP